MATSQVFLPFDNSTAAAFRAWGQGISLQLDTNFPKTTDTGQIDWTTTPAIPAAGTFAYEIRQPASDPLQTGSTAYFVKVEYGSIIGIQGDLVVRFSIGTATNGAGTFVGASIGPMGNSWPGPLASQGPANLFECDFSSDIDRFHCILWRTGPTTAPNLVSIERTKNPDGSNSSEGITLHQFNWSNVFSTGNGLGRTLVFGVGAANNTGPYPIGLVSSTVASDNFNNNIPLSPAFPDYGKFGSPLTGICIAQGPDIAEGQILTTTLFGSTRTYLMSKNGAMSRANLGLATAGAMGIRWD
jgi:hypothetical protein